MATKKRLPTWYKMLIEKRMKKLKTALYILDIAEEYLNAGNIDLALKIFAKAIKQSE